MGTLRFQLLGYNSLNIIPLSLKTCQLRQVTCLLPPLPTYNWKTGIEKPPVYSPEHEKKAHTGGIPIPVLKSGWKHVQVLHDSWFCISGFLFYSLDYYFLQKAGSVCTQLASFLQYSSQHFHFFGVTFHLSWYNPFKNYVDFQC